MKQHITEEQWNELSQKQKTIVCDWYDDELEQCLHVNRWPPTIGEMITFLEPTLLYINKLRAEDGRFIFDVGVIGSGWQGPELCDLLWSACKDYLNTLQTHRTWGLVSSKLSSSPTHNYIPKDFKGIIRSNGV